MSWFGLEALPPLGDVIGAALMVVALLVCGYLLRMAIEYSLGAEARRRRREQARVRSRTALLRLWHGRRRMGSRKRPGTAASWRQRRFGWHALRGRRDEDRPRSDLTNLSAREAGG